MVSERNLQHFRRMYKVLLRCTLLWSFIFGAFLGVVVYKSRHTHFNQKPVISENLYERWFNTKNLNRTYLTADYLQYGNYDKSSLESKYLYNQVKLMCVVLVRKKRYEIAAKNTWTKRCNAVDFVELRPERTHGSHTKLSFQRRAKSESSWRILCDAIRSVSARFSWALIVYDDLFVIPENARRMVAHLDPDMGHYLGHAVTLWGVAHNAAPAGYLLSRGAFEIIRNKFNSSDSCISGGRFWRQEDYHLGRHLSTAGVKPVDTRDSRELTTFHSSLPERLLPLDESGSRLNNGRASIYPVTKCCSPFSVTFRVAEADRMYTYEYLMYNMFVFETGSRGRGHPVHLLDDDSVWKSFVRERGLPNVNLSADAYFELWKTVVNDPVHFNKHIRNWQATLVSDLR